MCKKIIGVKKMRVGSWTECINPVRNKVKHSWFKLIHYKYDFCDLCLYEVQKRNGTLPISNGNQTNTQSYINHLTESKPEKDSL